MGDLPGETRGQDTESMMMELWDTVTNEITEVEQPPGLENVILFRPMILTFGEDSILFTGGSINNAIDYDGETFQYTCGTGWASRGNLFPALVSRQQYGTYAVKEGSPNQKTIFTACAEEPLS